MKRLITLLLILLCASIAFSQQVNNLCEGWSQKLGQPGLNSLSRDMVTDRVFNRVYPVGSYRYGGIPSITSFSWLDPETHRWHELGNFDCIGCGSPTLETLALDDSGHVYIGGFFQGVEDNMGNFITSKNVIRYNPYTEVFEPLALGLEANIVYDLIWRNDTLYAAGSVTAAKNLNGDIAVNNIALFDEATATWHAMGQGIGSHNLSTDDNGDVHAMDFDFNGYLYVGGRFSKINANDTVFSVARWSASSGWEGLNEKLFLAYNQQARKYPPLVNDIVFVSNPYNIYVTGHLGYNLGGNNILAAYDGTNWDYLGEGKPASTGGIYHGLTLHHGPLDKLLVGGNFNTFNDDATDTAPGNYIACYDVAFHGWGSMAGDGITKARPGLEVTAIASYWTGQDIGLYVSGNFIEANHFPVNYMVDAMYTANGYRLSAGVGQGAHEQCDVIHASAYFPHTKALIVGGSFKKIDTTYAAGLAVYDDKNGFSRFNYSTCVRNSSTPEVHCLYPGENKQLYIGGAFDSVRQDYPFGSSLSRYSPGLAQYHSWLGIWVPVVQSMGGNKTVYAISQRKGELIIGGGFNAVDGTTTRGLAVKDTSGTWKELANIADGHVRTMLVVHDSLLYIGGTFSSVNGQNIAGVAMYDGRTWTELGQNFAFYDDVYALAWDSLNNELVVGGSFDRVQQADGTDLMTQGLAFWDGALWSSRGDISAIFTNPSQYAPIVKSIASRGNGELFIGGEFSGVGGVNANRVARWIPGAGWRSLLDGGISENACYLAQNPSVNTLTVVSDRNRLYMGGNFNRSGLEQAGKFASYGLGKTGTQPIIDSILSACSLHYIFADSSFEDVRWSTGDTGLRLSLPIEFMDVSEKWISVYARKNSCLYTDSVLLKVGENMNVYAYTNRKWNVDSIKRRVSLFFTRKLNYVDSIHVDFGDGTRVNFSNDLGGIPDTISHIYTAPGSYQVMHWADNFCNGDRGDTTFVFGTTSIKETKKLSFSLFPNPNPGVFTLQYHSENSPVTIPVTLMDMMGKTVRTFRASKAELKGGFQVKLKDRAPGIYLLQLTDGNRRGTVQVCIQ